MYKLPELLCPAGDKSSLQAAIAGGADAVYFGGVNFNARRNAKNFDKDDMREAIKIAHAYGVKAYVTQNTLCYDREMDDYLSAAETAIVAGADALILADLGGALEIRKRFPDAELHASTQMSGHNVEAALMLHKMGFSRMVCAREMSYEDIKYFTENSPIEAEVFVHGAFCVCHSGQCLFSSIVGGRSGNRGECAQPCRLPYSGKYPLSLKDNALACHIPKLIECGVSSLKIEGRMKSAEYVRDVAKIYRRLLDECRGADKGEMAELSEIFSRGGFTDGYFTKKINKDMLGVRSEKDKQATRELEAFSGLTKKIPLILNAEILKDKPIKITLEAMGKRVEYLSDIVPFEAINAPITYDSVKKQFSKLGDTPYLLSSFELSLDEGLIVPVSALNRARREAVALLDGGEIEVRKLEATLEKPEATSSDLKFANFYSPKQITNKAKKYFDIIFLPLNKFDGSVEGVYLPPVIFDSEREKVRKMLSDARDKGAKYALVGNLGHATLASSLGYELIGDFRLNVSNNSSASVVEKLGFKAYIASPELTLPKVRDLGGSRIVTVYGRLPLMLLEKCVGRELGSCEACENGEAVLIDRTGAEFPVLREWEHRSVIYNSIPTSMSDKQRELSENGINGLHFIFTTESASECDAVIDAFLLGRPTDRQVRRLGVNTERK